MSTVELVRAASLLLGIYLVCNTADRGQQAAGLALIALVASTRQVVTA